jgi:superfamily II DNA or RNA helicase
MPAPATPPATLDLLAPGARVVVRDLEWQVEDVDRQAMGTRAIVRCIGRSELVRGQAAAFFSDIDLIEPEDPNRTRFVLDASPQGITTRLAIESLVRRTPLAVANTKVMVGHRMLADDLPFQREPFRKTTEQLQPRLLIADAVGLGKTLEVGIILSELQRRGRANRVLAVVPRHILDQVQHELWCRFAFPLVRLDSEGIRRLHQRIPAGRNPFAYYHRAIVSIDTLKQPGRYRHHLERVRWDVVWIDESHKLVNKGTYNNQLAQVLAPNADALILSSATPHNGKAESFAELVSLLDPTAVPDPKAVAADDIAHLVVRRHKHSPDVAGVIGDKWAERAEPKLVQVHPAPEEERVFAALSERWLPSAERRAAGATSVAKDPLFPYTLLKAALSSPKALHETVLKRLGGTKRLEALRQGAEATAEEAALRELHGLAEAALAAGSAKLDALVAELRAIGIGPAASTRAVVFSERIGTLDWIAEAVRARLNLPEDAVVTFHNGKGDEEQQAIVEDFAMASAPVRVLVTSDIASEGVNLHKQCHHLIHADLPWSLITTTQRNGRIDRYGQRHAPEIRYLVYVPTDPEVAGDVRVLSKLIAKEHEAHKALGDAASVMGLHSETAEEDAIVRALRERDAAAKEAELERVAPAPVAWDPWSFAGLDDPSPDPVDEDAALAAPPPAKLGTLRSLFSDDAAYLTQALRDAVDDQGALEWAADGDVLSFVPPEDLLRRLAVLPQSYLKQRELHRRVRLTTDPATAQDSLAAALEGHGDDDGGTAWPEVHYLGPQHPVLDWVADRILYRFGREEAPALVADVAAPTLLISGVWANRLGEPIADAWLAATVEDGLVTFEDLFGALERAGVRTGMVNAADAARLDELPALLGPTMTAAKQHLRDRLDDQVASVRATLERTRRRLTTWQAQARGVADALAPGAHQTARLENVERVTKQIEALLRDHQPADAPLLRVVGALLPSQGGRP